MEWIMINVRIGKETFCEFLFETGICISCVYTVSFNGAAANMLSCSLCNLRSGNEDF